MKDILFVCTGNTCRSPMAEGLARNFILNNPALKSCFSCSSAGISALEGQSASSEAVEVMLELFDINIHEHFSRQINCKILQNSSIILTMTNTHKKLILHQYPDNSHKIFTLKEYIHKSKGVSLDTNSNYDIFDPFGYDKKTYVSCASEIYELIKHLPRLLKV